MAGKTDTKTPRRAKGKEPARNDGASDQATIQSTRIPQPPSAPPAGRNQPAQAAPVKIGHPAPPAIPPSSIDTALRKPLINIRGNLKLNGAWNLQCYEYKDVVECLQLHRMPIPTDAVPEDHDNRKAAKGLYVDENGRLGRKKADGANGGDSGGPQMTDAEVTAQRDNLLGALDAVSDGDGNSDQVAAGSGRDVSNALTATYMGSAPNNPSRETADEDADEVNGDGEGNLDVSRERDTLPQSSDEYPIAASSRAKGSRPSASRAADADVFSAEDGQRAKGAVSFGSSTNAANGGISKGSKVSKAWMESAQKQMDAQSIALAPPPMYKRSVGSSVSGGQTGGTKLKLGVAGALSSNHKSNKKVTAQAIRSPPPQQQSPRSNGDEEEEQEQGKQAELVDVYYNGMRVTINNDESPGKRKASLLNTFKNGREAKRARKPDGEESLSPKSKSPDGSEVDWDVDMSDEDEFEVQGKQSQKAQVGQPRGGKKLIKRR